MAEKITNGLKHEFGSKWICFVGPIGLVSHFEAAKNSTLWFSNANVQFIVFRPLPQTQDDYLSDARKSNPKIHLLRDEMTESMKNEVISISLTAINNYNNFESIANNISAALQLQYGYIWNCFLSAIESNFSTKYISKTLISFKVEEIIIIIFQTHSPNIKVGIKFYYR